MFCEFHGRTYRYERISLLEGREIVEADGIDDEGREALIRWAVYHDITDDDLDACEFNSECIESICDLSDPYEVIDISTLSNR